MLGERSGVSVDGKDNIVFSRSHPQPRQLSNHLIWPQICLSLPPVKIETFLGEGEGVGTPHWGACIGVRVARKVTKVNLPLPRITSSFVKHIPGRRNMIYSLRTIFLQFLMKWQIHKYTYIFCRFCRSRILTNFHMLVRECITSVTSQLSRLYQMTYKPYIFWKPMTTTIHINKMSGI